MFTSLLDLLAQSVSIGGVSCVTTIRSQALSIALVVLDFAERGAGGLQPFSGAEGSCVVGVYLSLLVKVAHEATVIRRLQFAHQVLDAEICISLEPTDHSFGDALHAGIVERTCVEPLDYGHESAVFGGDGLRA